MSNLIPLVLYWNLVCTWSSAAVSTALLCWRSVLLLLLLSILLHSFWSVHLGSAELPYTGLPSFGWVGATPSCCFPHGSITRAVSSALQSIHIFTAFLSAPCSIATAWSCVSVTNTLMLFYTILHHCQGQGKGFIVSRKKGCSFPIEGKARRA